MKYVDITPLFAEHLKEINAPKDFRIILFASMDCAFITESDMQNQQAIEAAFQESFYCGRSMEEAIHDFLYPQPDHN